MVNLTIDNMPVSVPEGTSILDAAASVGINIPTLCYMKDLNEIGSCRVCVVEIEGIDKLVAACNNAVTDDMKIYTNSHKARQGRKVNTEFILSEHDCLCPTCVRNGNCGLQSLSADLGILDMPYKKEVPAFDWDKSLPLIRDDGKCIKCMRCIQVCDCIQDLGVWDIVGTGSRTTVGVREGKKIEEASCSLCGQCITHCPVGALRERNDVPRILDALADPEKITIIQVAPAVRAAWGESLGIPREKATAKLLVAAMRKIGFDYIFDTNFSADLTIMEEGSEFLEKLAHKEEHKFPMFTSCCPGWVRYIKAEYPDMVDQLSTAKSPQQMFGAVTKTYYAELLGVDPSKIFSVSVMPCVAKKHECEIPVMNDAGAGQDVDAVITTREIDRMIKADNVDVRDLKEEEFDTPLGTGTGAAVIFGVTGGVMEAALRSAYYLATGENPDPDAFKEIRGMDGWKEATFDIAGTPIKVGIASGLGNTRKLIEALRRGDVDYDFVEIMACPGGCAGGGGQPIADGQELAGDRGENLYGLDKNADIRFSHENPSIKRIYEEYLEKPLSHKSHELLHTDHNAWEMNKAKDKA